MYIGKHHATEYDKNYLGSGRTLKKAIKKYGKQNFENEVLFEACTIEELNEQEKHYIKQYKEKYGSVCYNIASGGDGGDTISGMSEEDRMKFIDKMTEINRERCSSDEFKQRISLANKRRYADPEERKRHSEKVKATWADPELRKRHGEYIRNYFKIHKKDGSYMFKSCVFELNNQIIHFESVKSLCEFLTREYNYTPCRYTFMKLMEEGKNRIPFKPFHKNKHGNLTGMMIYYSSDESVETNTDECKCVGEEISTSSKCKTRE